MKGRINNKMGEIRISSDVIALYAGTAAVECFGIVGMAAVSMKDGLVKLLHRKQCFDPGFFLVRRIQTMNPRLLLRLRLIKMQKHPRRIGCLVNSSQNKLLSCVAGRMLLK